MELAIVVANPASATYRRNGVEAECIVLGVFGCDREARRFVKAECRDNDEECCVV